MKEMQVPFIKGKTGIEIGLPLTEEGERMSFETFEVICRICNYFPDRVHSLAKKLLYHYEVSNIDLEEFIGIACYYESYNDDVYEEITGLKPYKE